MRRPTAALFLLLLAQAAGCSRQPALFSEPNARAHIGMLAGTIGSRPVGTPANARAREYIVDQLRLFGFEVRVQEADARRPVMGRTARVSNIIGVRPGTRSEAIGIVSHYDSVPAGPGAADDALGVGVALEAGRVLAARANRAWTLMILVTDGEEAGLMGAAALMTDRDVNRRLQAYINLEAIGCCSRPVRATTGCSDRG
jgi:acetylornithine deacetylase/succinyl-diaminopimelate desuccinylase-like protein